MTLRYVTSCITPPVWIEVTQEFIVCLGVVVVPDAAHGVPQTGPGGGPPADADAAVQ